MAKIIHAKRTLWVCLDTVYFVENWKLITENIIAKYFLKCKNTIHFFFRCWLVHKQCHETSPKNKTQAQKHLYANTRVCLAKIIFANLFDYLAYFCYYSWALLYFLVLFMSLNILFQLTFTFISTLLLTKNF